jgi:hypothetical protein
MVDAVRQEWLSLREFLADFDPWQVVKNGKGGKKMIFSASLLASSKSRSIMNAFALNGQGFLFCQYLFHQRLQPFRDKRQFLFAQVGWS